MKNTLGWLSEKAVKLYEKTLLFIEWAGKDTESFFDKLRNKTNQNQKQTDKKKVGPIKTASQDDQTNEKTKKQVGRKTYAGEIWVVIAALGLLGIPFVLLITGLLIWLFISKPMVAGIGLGVLIVVPIAAWILLISLRKMKSSSFSAVSVPKFVYLVPLALLVFHTIGYFAYENVWSAWLDQIGLFVAFNAMIFFAVMFFRQGGALMGFVGIFFLGFAITSVVSALPESTASTVDDETVKALDEPDLNFVLETGNEDAIVRAYAGPEIIKQWEQEIQPGEFQTISVPIAPNRIRWSILDPDGIIEVRINHGSSFVDRKGQFLRVASNIRHFQVRSYTNTPVFVQFTHYRPGE